MSDDGAPVDDPRAGAPDRSEPQSRSDEVALRDQMPRWVPRAILLFLVGLALLSVIEWTINRLQGLLLDLFVALFLSFALEPAVNWLQKHGWRRGAATAVSFLGLFLFCVVFLTAIGAVVVDQTQQFIDQAPEYSENVANEINDRLGTEISVDELQKELTREDGPVRGFATNLAGNAASVGMSALSVLFRLLTIGLFTFYLVADGPKFRRSVCSYLPARRQERVLETWEIAIDKTGGYLYSRSFLAVFSTAFHWVAFEMIGLPYSIALALFVGLVSQFVPTIGTYIAGALPVLVALAQDPIKALWVLGIVVVYQQIENYGLAPRVTARTMALHPAVAFGTVIAGAALFGGVGALLALPAAAVFQALGSTYIARHDVVDSDMTTMPQRQKRQRSWLTGRTKTDPSPGGTTTEE